MYSLTSEMWTVLCRHCYHILKNRAWQDDDEKIHFESGVHMGMGNFNLVHLQ